jgi:hypothetical protein
MVNFSIFFDEPNFLSPFDFFMKLDYYFMKKSNGDATLMANLQIKGIADDLYKKIKELAASENRAVSQQVLLLIKEYISRRGAIQSLKPPAQVLLELSGSWEDKKSADKIISQIKRSRKNSKKLKKGF